MIIRHTLIVIAPKTSLVEGGSAPEPTVKSIGVSRLPNSDARLVSTIDLGERVGFLWSWLGDEHDSTDPNCRWSF